MRWEDGHQWQVDTYRKEEVMAYFEGTSLAFTKGNRKTTRSFSRV
jgi:hypothetical protein